METEIHRPELLDDVLGHEEPKTILKDYLTKQPFLGAVFLTGSPGIGKTTLALCASRTFGFEPLEINASRSIRSFNDVEKLKDACASPVRINSLLRQNIRTTCVILDEIDGSDPHAQSKIMAWIKDPARKVPIICTGNETPSIFKRNKELVVIVRCFPPHQKDLEILFPNTDITSIVKECQHDVRRMIHRIQYGKSDTLPKYTMPPTGLGAEETFVRHQRMFGLPDPLEYRGDTQGTERS
jgi:DNA polymerase III delta prime subunit